MVENPCFAERLPQAGSVSFTWLGQAGFLVESAEVRIVIDPYLSDSLYDKYKDKKFPHVRMVPAPLRPDELTQIDLVLCTHGHTDHMDPGTLPVLASVNPGCRFICPASEKEKALDRGVPAAMFIGLDDGGRFDDSLNSGIVVSAVASAHETLEKDSSGRSLFLGYVIGINGLKIYHSGDCIPYNGLWEKLLNLKIDIAFLPVNGRDDFRKSNGIPGNFTVEEAADLCSNAGIEVLIPHHFGMFVFNSGDPQKIEQVLSKSGLKYTIPEIGKKTEFIKREYSVSFL